MLSMSEALICCVMAEGWPSFSLKTDSMTEISVEVVSCPQKAVQSLTTMPAPSTSEPRLTVPATRGIWRQTTLGYTHYYIFARFILLSHLEERGQFVLVCGGRLGVDESALIREGAVAAHQHVVGHRLPEDLHLEHVGQDLLRLPVQVGVHQGHVVVAGHHVAQGRQALLHALDADAVGEGVADLLELLREEGKEGLGL